MSLKNLFSLELPNNITWKGFGEQKRTVCWWAWDRHVLLSPLTLEYPLTLEESFEGTILSSVTWCHNLDPICVCKPKCFSQHLKSLHSELFIDSSDMAWVLSQQLWRGKKESTREGQPGWHVVPVLLILVPVHPVPHLPSVCLCWAQGHWQELPGHCLVLSFPLLQKQ